MHYRTVIVIPNLIAVCYVLIEVVNLVRIDVRGVDSNELIAILSAMLVPESNHVSDLMNYITGLTLAPQVYKLWTTLLAHC